MPTSQTLTEFQTNKGQLTEGRIVETSAVNLGSKQIRAKVDRFAFTANNITYAVMGDRLKYWEFFPPAGGDSENWGVIPVWGFADVVESNSDEIKVGERLFGYFPPTNELVMTPSHVSDGAFLEASDHRSHLPAGYNLYRRVNAEPGYDPKLDNERMLLFVLHLTSFSLHDLLESNDWFGAKQVVIISASSKTSTGLAYGLAADENAPPVIGLTSARNLDMVQSLGVYDDAHTYDELTKVDASIPTVIVDMSANSDVLSRLHTHLGDNMMFTSNVGLTHWEEPQKVDGINQARSQMFFAPGHIQQRIKEWGREEFDKRSMKYIMHSVAKSREWLKIRELDGIKALAEVYEDVCEGRIAADEGLVVVL